jgi:outer membrane immunogenic protein
MYYNNYIMSKGDSLCSFSHPAFVPMLEHHGCQGEISDSNNITAWSIEIVEIYMQKFVLAVAVFAAFAATPAYAKGEGRVEAYGGIAFAGGTSEAFAGIGGGFDFDLGDKAFVGLDVGVSKVLARGTKAFGNVGGRIGAKLGENGRIYASGGLGFCCGGSDPYFGAGYQHKFGQKIYGKIEYRKSLSSFGPDINFAGIGLGIGF